MSHVARQATPSDDVPAEASSDTVAPSTSLSDPASQDTSGAASSDVESTGASVIDATDSPVAGPSVASIDTTTAAVSDPDPTALPSGSSSEQTFTSGASDASVAATSTEDTVQPTASDVTTSDPSQSISETETSPESSIDSSQTSIVSASITTETASASSTLLPTTTDSTSSTSSTTSESSSTSSESTFSSSSSSSTQSTSDSSSSSSSTTAASTSLTTSFTEIVSTIDGKVTTIVTPVATLNASTAGTETSSDRTAIIAGATAGGAALIILCLLAVFLYKRHQKRRLALSHRYLPTPRSVMLAGEDDFDLAGPSQPRRGFTIFGNGPRRDRGNMNDTGGVGADDYRNLGSDSGRDVNSPVMRELPSEPPPRLLRPVASKTGSYFQEAVWPPPDEGSRLVDPLMAASNVDLHSIVDEVMGPQGQFGSQHQIQNRNQNRRLSAEASSSTTSPSQPARLRGGAGDRSSSLYSESETPTPTDFGTSIPPFVPIRHGESPTMSSIDSAISISDSARHQRDWSTDSATGLLAGMDRSTRRSSGGSGGSWLPPGAAPPSTYSYGRATSPTLSSPLRNIAEPAQQQTFASLTSSSRAQEKASEAAQERRGSLVVANPGPEEARQAARGGGYEGGGPSSSTTHSSSLSLSISTSSTQRLRRAAGGSVEAPGTGAQTPYPDESPIDRRSIPPSLAHAWLLDIDEEEYHDDDLTPRPTPGPTATARPPREELPPRYDMIRRDSEEAVSRMRTL